MSVSTAEAKAKLSLDMSTLDKGKRDIANFGDHAHRSFLHASKPAREFHHVLGEVSQQSAVAGLAIKTWLAPTAGILAAVGLAAKGAFDELKDFGEVLELVGKSGARTFGDVRKAMAEARKEVAASRAEFVKMVAELTNPLNALQSAHKAEQDRLRLNYDVAAEQRATAREGMLKGATPEQKELLERGFKREDALAKGKLLTDQLHAQQRAYGLIGEARKKVAAGVLAYQAGAGARGTRASLLSKTTLELEDAKKELAEQEAIRERLAPLHREFENAEAGGVGEKALMGARHFMGAIMGTTREQLNMFEVAERRIKQLNDVIEHNTNLKEKLTEAGKAESDRYKELVGDLGKLDSAYDHTRGEINSTNAELLKLAAAAPPLDRTSTSPIDPTTGGYAYRGIADKGGYAYNDLLHRPPSFNTKPIGPTEIKGIDQLIALATGSGIKVVGSD
jgi:hypothetical protein